MSISVRLKKRSIPEKVIGILSILIGSFCIWYSAYLIWNCYYKGGLWSFVKPMTYLVSELVIGVLLILSAIMLVGKENFFSSCYKFCGLVICLFFINQEFIIPFLDQILFEYEASYYFGKLYLIPFVIGIALFLFFNRKKYKEGKKYKLESNTSLFALSIILYTIINICFINWSYF